MKKIIQFILLLTIAINMYGQDHYVDPPILDNPSISLGIGESSKIKLMTNCGTHTNITVNTVDLILCEDLILNVSYSTIYEINKAAYIKIENITTQECYNTGFRPLDPTDSSTIFSQKLSKGEYIFTLGALTPDPLFPAPTGGTTSSLSEEYDYSYMFTFTASTPPPPPPPTPIVIPPVVIPEDTIPGPDPIRKIPGPFNILPKDVMEKYSSDQNYVATFSSIDGTEKKGQTEIQYYDELGRPDITVALQASPTGKDLATAQTYWNNQKSRVWLPSVTTQSNGNYIDIAQVEQYAKATYNDLNPYNEVIYEKSPLNRVNKSFGPGEEWRTHNRANQTQYLTNIPSIDSLSCKRFSAVCNLDKVTITATDDWNEGSLQVIHSTNEDGKSVLIFNDIQGKKVLSRQVVHNSENETEYYDTYYVYNALDQLLAILPPNVSSKLHYGQWSSTSNEVLKQSAYLFSYANGFQPIAKKQPGTAWSYYIYDEEGHTILCQSGEDRTQNVWQFQIPDEFDRTVLTGTCTNDFTVWTEPLANISIYASDSQLRIPTIDEPRLWGYTMNIQLENPDVYTVNYYDSYYCLGFNGLPEYANPDYTYDKLEGYGECTTANFTGLLTCSINKVLSNDKSENKYTHSVFYYDDKNRVIQSNSSTHLDSLIEKAYFKYNYSGNLLKQRLVHQNNSNTTIEDYEYTYDSQSRLLTCQHSINGEDAVTIVDNEYDALGRMVSNKRNGQAVLEDSITRNIRSWVTGINNDLFKQEIHYTDGYNNSQPLFSGNICAINWSNKDQNSNECYTYKYDDLMHLMSAKYHLGNTATDSYSTQFAYDKMGNITSLQRHGSIDNNSFGLIDNISYQYVGNQLVKTEDSSDKNKGYSEIPNASFEYTYDSDGRMTKDLNKGIKSISYYANDRPQKLIIDKPGHTGYACFKYSAKGNKLQQKIILDEQTTPDDSHFIDGVKTKDYIGNQELINGKINRIKFAGGYIEKDQTGSWSYNFYINDYQGNIRCVTDASGKVIQRNDYYPFGLPYASNTNSNAQPYKYGGKEYIKNLELDMYDFEARMMNPAIGRFTMMDSYTENYAPYSPYCFVLNNPIVFSDPDGNNPIYNLNGDHIGNTSEGFTGQIYIYDGGQDVDWETISIKSCENMQGLRKYDYISTKELSGIARGKIMTNVLNHAVGWNIGGYIFEGMNVEFGHTKSGTFACMSNKIDYRNIDKLIVSSRFNYHMTVENILNTLLYHEWLGHIKQGYATKIVVKKPIESKNSIKRFFHISDYIPEDITTNTHYKCYENSILSPLFDKTTLDYKRTIFKSYNGIRQTEHGVEDSRIKEIKDKFFKK